MGALVDKVSPDVLHGVSYFAVIMIGVLAAACEIAVITITYGLEKREFRCKTTAGEQLTELYIQENCYKEYSLQYDKKQFPLSAFVGILNTFFVVVVTLGYTAYVKSRVVKRTYNDRTRTFCCKVFTAYMTQLVLRVIILAVILCSQWILYPVKFPSQFFCPAPQDGLKNNITGVNATKAPLQIYNCTNDYAEEKTIVGGFLFVINLLGFILSFGEMVYLIRQVCKDPTYCEDEKFCPNYLSSETPENPITPPEQVKLRGW